VKSEGTVREVFFGTNFNEQTIHLIRRAQQRVWLASYVAPVGWILQALGVRAQNGVDVHLLLGANTVNKYTRQSLARLNGQGVKTHVVNYQNQTMHAKFLVVDDQVMTGSSNWSETNSFNCAVLLDGPVVESFAQQYERLRTQRPAQNLSGERADELMAEAFSAQGRSNFLLTVDRRRQQRGFITPGEERALLRIINGWA